MSLNASIEIVGPPDWFEHAKQILGVQAVSTINTATTDAVEVARQAAVNAAADCKHERLLHTDAVALGMAARLGADAAMTSLMEYIEEFNTAAAVSEDVDFEIASIVHVLRGARS
jgi:hypothetical protein